VSLIAVIVAAGAVVMKEPDTDAARRLVGLEPQAVWGLAEITLVLFVFVWIWGGLSIPADPPAAWGVLDRIIGRLAEKVGAHIALAILVLLLGRSLHLITSVCAPAGMWRLIGPVGGWLNLLVSVGIMGLLALRQRLWLFCGFVVLSLAVDWAMQHAVRVACGS
jgi:hypothetical protein